MSRLRSPDAWSRFARHLFVAVAWSFVLVVSSRYGMRLLPLALARTLSLQGYLTFAELLATAFGLLLAWLLLPEPRRALGLERVSPLLTAGVMLITPAVFVITSYLAIAVSVPLLLEELRAGGVAAAQRNTGEYGVELTHAPALLTLLWGAGIAPICEELLFRGALFSAVQQFVRAVFGDPDPVAPDNPGLVALWSRWFQTGGIATFVSTLCFGALHADMSGGLGRIRFVSALGLGLACGLIRQHTRSLVPAIALHAVLTRCPSRARGTGFKQRLSRCG